jgi:hypothetical protein
MILNNLIFFRISLSYKQKCLHIEINKFDDKELLNPQVQRILN